MAALRGLCWLAATLLDLRVVSGRGVVPARYASMGLRARRGHRAAAGVIREMLPKPQYVTQRQDHFDGSNPSTWQQAFFVNDTFWVAGTSSPVFLCIGGEGPMLDGTSVVSSVHCNVAVEWLRETGALMFALEHRYYGCHNVRACPVSDLKASGAYRFLSSRQALADIAAFVQHASEAYGVTAANKWVTWGGSYPGMLAGWARLKFPHLIHASVSSSAPVRAELDMRGYNDVVAAAYAVEHESVGGSVACQQAIAAGHRQIGALFKTPTGREVLSGLFGESPEFWSSREHQVDFAGQGVAEFPAQSNDPTCKEALCNIASICVAMTNASLGDEVHRLAHVRDAQLSWMRLEMEATYVSVLELAEDPTPGYSWETMWGWQTCTEFGFYKTCEEGSSCFYTQGLATLEEEEGFCKDLFGIPLDTVKSNIDFSNTYYGSDHPQGTRILYVNGEVDPWHANSINVPISFALPAIYVEGASHHAWTHQSLSTDQPSVVATRTLIRQQVSAFLVMDPGEEEAAGVPIGTKLWI